MKGFRKCFGVLLLCSITLGASFVGYSDTNAVTYTSSLKFSETIATSGYKCGFSTSENSTIVELNSTCSIPGIQGSSSAHRYLNYIKTNNTYDISTDKFYLIRLFVRINTQTDYPLPYMYSFPNSDDLNFTVVDVDVNFDGRQPYFASYGVGSAGGLVDQQIYPAEVYPQQIIQYDILLRPRQSGNSNIKFSKSDSKIFDFYPYSGNGIIDSPPIQIYIQNNIDVYEFDNSSSEMNEKDEQDRDNLESQSSDTDSASASSSSDAESTGTTLLGAFSAFVTAITSASPSNCNLDMDLGNLDLGVVNLCSLSPPQPIPTIASIFMILFCVPLSISTARKVINLFRSFQ